MTGSMNFGMASPYIETFGIAQAAAAKIYSVIDSIPVINQSKGKGERPDKIEGNIVLQDVHFQYPSRPTVQVNINCTFVNCSINVVFRSSKESI